MVVLFHHGIIVSAATRETDHADAALESKLFQIPIHRAETDPGNSAPHSFQDLVGGGVVA
jgi:hypothetical protein